MVHICILEWKEQKQLAGIMSVMEVWAVFQIKNLFSLEYVEKSRIVNKVRMQSTKDFAALDIVGQPDTV